MSTVTKNVRPSATFWRVSNILKTPGPFFFKSHIYAHLNKGTNIANVSVVPLQCQGHCWRSKITYAEYIVMYVEPKPI